ncbi:DNA-3-methyladenine glycosylase [Paenibacillus sp. NFR01]|uniref:DNA-3-methyladenine glycosylase family protein n=1 Tax=Paenibacillus sp. NFR01 TaxID=1566279 RepID=UPI0008D8B7E3|nr:DNA-3-methyladenine glycosylase [Paenibacillus sp. NFR01]SEU23442.1 DNA-3-methyladenine glycosylase II [Paenibacillus sp. NFR01]
MNDLLFEMALPPDFRWDVNLDYMNRSPLECLYVPDASGVNRLFAFSGGPALIRAAAAGDRLKVMLLAGVMPAPQEQQDLAVFIAEWFDLDRDLRPFYALAAADPLLAPLAERERGLRIIALPGLFEALCWAILGQQVNLAFAYKLKERLTQRYGGSLEWQGRTYYHFPRPDVFGDVSEEELCTLQLTRNKARAVLEVARLLAAGELSREELLALPPQEAEARLLRIRGVGPWTSQYVRMRCLRDTTAFPAGDVGLQNAVKFLAGMDRKPTPAELIEMAARWKGWEAYAVFYLWRALY